MARSLATRIARNPYAFGALLAAALTGVLVVTTDASPYVTIPGLLVVTALAFVGTGEAPPAPALSVSYGRHGSLFERLSDPMLVVAGTPGDPGVIERANGAACVLFGRTAEELRGTPIGELLPALTTALQQSLSALVRDRGSLTTEHMLWSGGELRRVSVAFYPVLATERDRTLLVIKDLADKASAERALTRRERQLEELSACTRSINATLRSSEVMRGMAESTRRIVRATTAMVGIVHGDSLVLEEYLDSEGIHTLGISLAPGECVAGRMWNEMAPFMTNDAPREASPCPVLDSLFQPVNVLAVPIVGQDGEFVGCVVALDKADSEPFDNEDMLVAYGLASSGAIALQNARILDELTTARAELIAQREDLQRLAGELSRTEERERRRIAEELHDRIGQELAVIRMKLSQAKAAHSIAGSAELSELRGLVEQTIADTRTLTFEISPPMLYALGLAPTLEWLCEQLEQQHDIAMSVDAPRERCRIPDDARALLYVCVRELLMNVVKHAGASSAQVVLSAEGDTLRIAVRDDGVGFTAGERSPGFGLFSIRERLAGIGATLEIDSEAGCGTTVTIEAPVGTGD